MTDPTLAFVRALYATEPLRRERVGLPAPGSPAYAEWKALTDELLAQARAWWTQTTCRDWNTIIAQVASFATTRWRATYGAHCAPEDVEQVELVGFTPAVRALLDAQQATVAAQRAAREQGRAAA